ncbi:hypothetical protein SASPL_100808 [Salvia splendens]|uniref:20S proteasome subunit beta 3 n=1 Tax=Salvia splendens TaxID=180675 RepID=A0A8X9ABA9_SALSN|nr:hypothetical protein SASPL_100808 [Salvia splendens]
MAHDMNQYSEPGRAIEPVRLGVSPLSSNRAPNEAQISSLIPQIHTHTHTQNQKVLLKKALPFDHFLHLYVGKCSNFGSGVVDNPIFASPPFSVCDLLSWMNLRRNNCRSLSIMGAPWWRWWGRTASRSPATGGSACSCRRSPPTSRRFTGSTISSSSVLLALLLMRKLSQALKYDGIYVRVRYQRLVFRHKLYHLREERDMKPETFSSLVSAVLYEKRFGPYFCQPVIAGLGDDDKPFICTMDSIGAKELAKDFVVAGTASESLYGACESMFKPDMEAEELFETISQALISSVDRDCLSGWGGHAYLVTPTEVTERILKGRMD